MAKGQQRSNREAKKPNERAMRAESTKGVERAKANERAPKPAAGSTSLLSDSRLRSLSAQ
jgi:hypothetical protein